MSGVLNVGGEGKDNDCCLVCDAISLSDKKCCCQLFLGKLSIEVFSL